MRTLGDIPSRASNPFATCWTRPGALPFHPTRRADPSALLERLRDNAWRGQVLGPHGAGKSTLLRSLERLLAEAGRPVVWRRVSKSGVALRGAGPRGQVCLVDGFELLPRWRRMQWRRRTRREGWGLVVTAHRPVGLPTLATLEPSLDDVLRCFRTLTRDHGSPVTEADARSAFLRCGVNVREIWFDLYDRHEQITRAVNPGPIRPY